MRLLIIQTSPPHTASTLLVNAIYGIIPELFDKRIIGMWNTNFEYCFENIIAVKSHETNIDHLINVYGNKYKLVFICSERAGEKSLIDAKYRTYENVVIFDFDELNETNNNTLINIVDNFHSKIKHLLTDTELDKTKCIERMNLMNNRYEEIKSRDFGYVDPFFEIHGSHRNRVQDYIDPWIEIHSQIRTIKSKKSYNKRI